MASSGYASWSVTAGEVPTATKWGILGQNDSSFNTGNGFNDGILLPRHFGNNSVPGTAQGVQNIFMGVLNANWTIAVNTWELVNPSSQFAVCLNTGASPYLLGTNDIQLPYSGIYDFTWHAGFNNLADGAQVLAGIGINDATGTQPNLPWIRTTVGAAQAIITAEMNLTIPCNSGDQINIWVYSTGTEVIGSPLASGLPSQGDGTFLKIDYRGTKA